MKWTEFLTRFTDHPLFHSNMLTIFDEPTAHLRIQLARWVRQGKLTQVRREWYLVEEPFRKNNISPARIANQVVHPSYLSLEWALAHYGLIPEFVPNLTSVTTQRGVDFTFKNLGFFYHHLMPSFFIGYREITMDRQKILIALPEKALADKIYLFTQSNRWSMTWLRELRLQNMDEFDLSRFENFSRYSKLKGLKKAFKDTISYIKEILE